MWLYQTSGYEGWAGKDKMFITKVQVHNDGAKDIPTIWILSANIVRTAQYGCN